MSNLAHISDEVLMSSLQKGDESAFNELYDRYSNRILYYMYKMLRQDEAKSQDFTQDVFLKIIESADKFDTSKNFKTWVFTIAANHCKNYFRSNKQTLDIENTDTPEPSYDSTTINYEQQEFRMQLNNELDKLSAAYKETFMLRHHEGLKLKEIAEILNCPLGTVKSRLNFVTQQLAEKLKAFHLL